MFSRYHIIWLGISLFCASGMLIYLKHKKIELKKVLYVCCAICILSEMTKVVSSLQILPSSDGTEMHLFLGWQHMPFHLCTLQIAFIFIAAFTEKTNVRQTVLAFIYPTAIAGAAAALLMPSIFTDSIRPEQAFVHPIGYQYFLFHTMLIVLGCYIPLCKETQIRPKHFFTTQAILCGLAFGSLYLNSMLAIPHYVGEQAVSVDYSTNFLFTYRTPIGIALTRKSDWYCYMGVLILLAAVLLLLFYLPVWRKGSRKQ